ncbi:AraC family transcriptional regulator [Parvularcula sp. LCG005]|uniref:AraC family transcriptional regulator n=1 Tax=Parvularcula sp. LCG005 TaxID=3078805 RepID=UPI002943ED9E|nr:AraC family transcriptional regulator [Parvularcula sp. LCG005]WOI53189.1 AraC family transcriptional regulator [Parvularcula sp. LCG005]
MSIDSLAEIIAALCPAPGRHVPFAGVTLTRADDPYGMIHAVYEPSFCIVAQGDKLSMLGDQAFRYGAGQGLLAAVDVPVTARITTATPAAPYLAMSVAIDPDMVAELALRQLGMPSPAEIFAPLSSHDVDQRLFDPLIRLLSLVRDAEDVTVLRPLIQQEIVWRLLNSPFGPALRHMGAREGQAGRVRQVMAHIRAHFAESLKVADLAALAHMSVPSFHRHFKAVTTMTPVHYQKLIRLQEARQRMMADSSVAAAGYAVGYESASQFSRDYRRHFGLPPAQDSAALREQMASAL